MKILLTLSLMISCYWGFGQTFHEIRPIKGEVLEIKQIHFKNNWFRSGWKSYFQYDSLGRLVRRINYYKKEKRMDQSFEYFNFGNNQKIITKYTNKNGYSIELNYFDDQGRLVKSEIYLDKDTINPERVSHAFIYNPKGKTQSYKNTQYFKNLGNEKTDCFELNYNEDYLIGILSYDSCKTITKKRIIEYDKKRNPVKDVIDHLDQEIVILGGRSENGIEKYYYVFDKRDNWIKRYYETSKGKRILELKRKIKYKNGGI